MQTHYGQISLKIAFLQLKAAKMQGLSICKVTKFVDRYYQKQQFWNDCTGFE